MLTACRPEQPHGYISSAPLSGGVAFEPELADYLLTDRVDRLPV